MSFKTLINIIITLSLIHSAAVEAVNIDQNKRPETHSSYSSIHTEVNSHDTKQISIEKFKRHADHNQKTRLTKIETLGSIVVMSAVAIRLILYAYSPDNLSLAGHIGMNTALIFGAIGGSMKGCLGAQRVSELKYWIKYCWRNTSSYSEFNKKICGSKYGKKEVCIRSMLALFGIWISVSAGLDGFRIIKQAMHDYGSIGGAFMGIPEILAAIFNSVESGYLFAIKSRNLESNKNTYEPNKIPIIPIILNKDDDEERKSPYTQKELRSNQVITMENGEEYSKISAQLEKNSLNNGTVYQVEISNSKGEKAMAFLLAGASSYFLISIEQLTFLYIMFPENLWLSHVINMFGMGGHLIADYFIGYTNILSLTKCLKKNAKEIFNKCSSNSKNKKYKLSITKSNGVDNNISPCDVSISCGELPDNIAKSAIKYVEEKDKQNKHKSSGLVSYCSNVGAFVIIAGFGWSEGYYQWSLSNEVMDCVKSVAYACAKKGVIMSSVLSSTTEAWPDFNNITAEIISNYKFLSNSVECPIAANICSADQQSFYQYAALSSLANKYLAGATALKALIFIQELSTIKHFFRRTKNTLIYPFKKACDFFSNIK